jgi:hypothetical protein
MRRALAAALVVALGLGLVACGGDRQQENAYVDAVNHAQGDFAATFDRLSKQITATSTPAQDRRTLRRFRAAVDRAVVRLRAIEVPDRVRGLHGRLVDEISAYGRQIDKARSAFRSRNAQAVLTAQTDLVSEVTRVSGQINRTIDAINGRLKD